MSGFGNVPPFYVAGPPVTTTNTRTTAFTGGAIGSGWTFTKDAETGVAESIARFSVSDETTAALYIENGSSTDASFNPLIRGVNTSTGQAINLTGQGTTDTGTTAIVSIRARIGTASGPSVRPMITMNTNTTVVGTWGPKGKYVLLPANSTAATASIAPTFSVTVPADTARTAATAANQIVFDCSATQTWSNGTVPEHLQVSVLRPTLNGTSGTSSVFTTAATVAIDNAPALGANTSASTNLYAFWVKAGLTQLDGGATFGLRANLKSYTVATLPAVGVAGGMVWASDAGGNGPCLALSNGTNWKRCDNTGTTVA